VQLDLPGSPAFQIVLHFLFFPIARVMRCSLLLLSGGISLPRSGTGDAKATHAPTPLTIFFLVSFALKTDNVSGTSSTHNSALVSLLKLLRHKSVWLTTTPSL